MSRIEMFRRLGALKERLGDELYIKVVIPEDSGLSYNEAWGFTKAVLTEFDYYYIDGWEASQPVTLQVRDPSQANSTPNAVTISAGPTIASMPRPNVTTPCSAVIDQ